MALDRSGEAGGKSPATGEHAADQGVVDPELAPLAMDPLLGGTGVAVDLGRIGGVGVDQDELADVMEQRRGEQLVAVL